MTFRRQHAFGFFLAAFLTGDFAFQIQSVAVAWQVFEIRHATIDLCLVGLAAFLPTFVLALVAGHIADRYDRKRIALLAAIGSTLSSVAFVVLAILQVQAIMPYLGVVLGLGIVHALGGPAEGTLLVSIVPPERFLTASARFSALGELVVIGGPAAGGALIALGPPIAFSVSAAISAVSVVALALLFVEPRPPAETAPTLRDAF